MKLPDDNHIKNNGMCFCGIYNGMVIDCETVKSSKENFNKWLKNEYYDDFIIDNILCISLILRNYEN